MGNAGALGYPSPKKRPGNRILHLSRYALRCSFIHNSTKIQVDLEGGFFGRKDIVAYIARFLQPQDVLALRLCCRILFKLLSSPAFYSSLMLFDARNEHCCTCAFFFSTDWHIRAFAEVGGKVVRIVHEPSSRVGLPERVTDLSCSNDFFTIASCSSRHVLLWDARTKQKRALLPIPGTLTCGDVGKDGLVVATGSFDQTLRLWSTSKDASRLIRSYTGRIYASFVSCCRFNHSMSKVAAFTRVGTNALCDVETNGESQILSEFGPGLDGATCLEWIDEFELAVGKDNGIAFADTRIQSHRNNHHVSVSPLVITCLAHLRSSPHLLLAGDDDGNIRYLDRRKTDGFVKIAQISDSVYKIQHIACSPAGGVIFAVAHDDTVWKKDVSDQHFTREGQNVRNICFNGATSEIVFGRTTGTIDWFKVTT